MRCRCATPEPGSATAKVAATPNRRAIARVMFLLPFPDYFTNPIFWIGDGVIDMLPLDGIELK